MNNDNQKQHDQSDNRGNLQEGKSGTATERAHDKGSTPASGAYKNETGDPGRTRRAAEGVENFEKTGNE